MYVLKHLYPKYIRNSQNSIKIINNQPNKKWAKDLTRNFIKEDRKIENKYIKRCSKSLVTQKMKIKTQRVCHEQIILIEKSLSIRYPCIRMTKLKKIDCSKCQRGHRGNGTLTHYQWNRNDTTSLEKLGSFLKSLTYTYTIQPRYPTDLPMKNESRCSHRDLYVKVHSCFMCKSKTWKQSACCYDQQIMEEETVVQ